jgi:CHAD domain-containing protein
VSVDCSVRAYRRRDGEGKTVLRARLERATAEREGRRRRLRTTVRLVPVAGYGAEVEEAAERLAAAGLASAGDLLTEALAAVRAKAPPPSIHDVVLDPEERAEGAVRRLLAVLLAGIGGNVDGVRRDVDPEFLHDLRVAVRRSRTALARIRDVLPEKTVGPLREELRWLGQLSGPARDLDVWLLGFDELAALVPGEARADLEPLRDVLRGERAAARAELVAALDGPRFAALLDSFQALVRAKARRRGAPAAAALPVVEVARREIDRAYRRVLRDGRAVTDASTPAELHELRKTCKKLRYLLELFRSLFPDDAGAILAALRALQETLGTIQDQEVQVAALATLGEEMGGPPATLLAMGALAAELLLRQRAARGELAVRFAAFDARPLRRIAKRLFREPVDRAAA